MTAASLLQRRAAGRIGTRSLEAATSGEHRPKLASVGFKIGCTPRGSCINALLRRVLRMRLETCKSLS